MSECIGGIGGIGVDRSGSEVSECIRVIGVGQSVSELSGSLLFWHLLSFRYFCGDAIKEFG